MTLSREALYDPPSNLLACRLAADLTKGNQDRRRWGIAFPIGQRQSRQGAIVSSLRTSGRMVGAGAVVDTTGAPLPDTIISSPAPTQDALEAVDLKRHLERVLEETRPTKKP